MTIKPTNVHSTLSKYILADGFDLVYDMNKSKGSQIYDSRTGQYLLDCFSFFATSPLGCNHPALATPEFKKKMGEIAINNPTNSDIYTVEMADFVDTFGRLAMPKHFQHLFFVAGGALGIENGIKTAFDWKVRKNLARGKGELGHQVIHFKDAFHGRTGYTLSMTNTFNQDKTKFFTKFDWPRIINPKIQFPLTKEHLQQVRQLEQQAIQEIEQAVKNNSNDIAALIIEPIQAEGGDNHFRKEFFLEIRRLCDQHEMMFIVDEVQCGMGLTGKLWAYQHFGFEPDILAFGKKTQICGIMVSNRVDEITNNVFKVPSRLNSTWGGNLVDMVRCQKYLEVMKEENLVKNAENQGKQLLKGLEEMQEKYPQIISNARGRGLMCAFDLPTPEQRDSFKQKLYEQKVIILGCGASTVRFRPPLTFTSDDVTTVLSAIDTVAHNF